MLTACGIETGKFYFATLKRFMLQQCLPLAVLKLEDIVYTLKEDVVEVATVLTACGIETCNDFGTTSDWLLSSVATVLTACGIETYKMVFIYFRV